MTLPTPSLHWKFALVGYGEVGQILAEDLRKIGLAVSAGGRYVEGAVMTSIPPYRIRVPLLLGGPQADRILAACDTSFPRKRESTNPDKPLDSRFRGNDED